MNPRYFIGITLPENLSSQIEQTQRDLFQPQKVMPPLKPHITLLHPNLLQTLAPQHFIPKIKDVADDFLPFEVSLTKTGMFDRRVLYIDVHSERLISFQKALVGLLPAEIKAQHLADRLYKPHITLVQSKPKQNLSENTIPKFISQVEPLLPNDFTVDHIKQFTWLRPRAYNVKRI